MILLLSRCFYPDVEGGGHNLATLACSLGRSFPMEVVCGRSYTGVDQLGYQSYDGLRILRVPHTRFPKKWKLGRIANWITFCISAAVACLALRPSLLFVQTDPPILGILSVILSRLIRCQIILNCRDLYPDVAIELGIVRRTWLVRFFDFLNNIAYREARATVALGEDMARRIAAKGVPHEKLIVIPNTVDTTEIVPIQRSENPYVRSLGLSSRFTIMYSGNIGLTQDFDTFLRAVAQIPTCRSRWLLLLAGEGAARSTLETTLKDLNLLENTILLPSQPRESLGAFLGAGSLHVVPMKKGLQGCVVPGKVYTIMAAGRPYLAVCERGCDIASLAMREGCGMWAEAGNVELVRNSLTWAIDHPQEIEVMGRKAREVAVSQFDTEIEIRQWHSLFQSVLDTHPPKPRARPSSNTGSPKPTLDSKAG